MSTQPGDGAAAGTAARDDISRTEMLPFLLPFRDLRKRAFLWPGLTTASFAAALLILAATNEEDAFFWCLSSYFSLVNLYLVFLWCGRKQPFPYVLLVAALAFVFDAVILEFIIAAERALPKAISPGLIEEAVKAVPLAVVFLIGRRLSHHRERKYGLREPLDGILLAAASATGFAYLETMFVYVPHYGALISAPRLLVNVFGHIAYTGALGYFVGLAALHRHSAWKAALAILVGFVIANLLHDLWDAIRFYTGALALMSPLHEVAIALVSFVVLASTILKGREVSPEREFLWPYGSLPPYQAPEVDPLPAAPALPGDFWLQIGTARTRLVEGLSLTVREIACLEPRTADGIIAEVRRHPNDRDILVLRNLSKASWEAVLPDGTVREIEPAGTVRLGGGTRLDFGGVHGAILLTAHDPESDPPPQAEEEWC
jgi:RsiW-degrading membrane proteinase PrsW (M82 family)